MENKIINKIYFIPGDLVTIKHNLDNKPIMLVTEVVTSSIVTLNHVISTGDKKNSAFRGIRCGWFDIHQIWNEQIFSTKDLEKVEEDE